MNLNNFRNKDFIVKTILLLLLFSCTSVPEILPPEKRTLAEAQNKNFFTYNEMIQIQNNEKILVLSAVHLRNDVYYKHEPGNNYFTINRYSKDGVLDTSFRCDPQISLKPYKDLIKFHVNKLNEIILIFSILSDKKTLKNSYYIYHIDSNGKLFSEKLINLENIYAHKINDVLIMPSDKMIFIGLFYTDNLQNKSISKINHFCINKNGNIKKNYVLTEGMDSSEEAYSSPNAITKDSSFFIFSKNYSGPPKIMKFSENGIPDKSANSKFNSLIKDLGIESINDIFLTSKNIYLSIELKYEVSQTLKFRIIKLDNKLNYQKTVFFSERPIMNIIKLDNKNTFFISTANGLRSHLSNSIINYTLLDKKDFILKREVKNFIRTGDLYNRNYIYPAAEVINNDTFVFFNKSDLLILKLDGTGRTIPICSRLDFKYNETAYEKSRDACLEFCLGIIFPRGILR